MRTMDIRIIIILVFFRSTLGTPTIEITDLSTNPGLLILATGNSLLKEGCHKIYHIINLDDFWPIFKRLDSIINGLSSFGNFTELTGMVSTKFSNVQNLYLNLLPKWRAKRGLLNFIGSGIKQITGNMDHEDFIEITEELNHLKSNNLELIRENNRQIRINTKMQDRINAIIKELKDQQKIITKNLIEARPKDGYSKDLKIIKEVFNINYNLDHLKHHIENLIEAIHFAKLNIISKHILNPDELSFALKELEGKGIIIDNNEQVYDYLDVTAFFNQSKLIFIIEVPLIQDNAYNSFLLEALPVGNKIMNLPTNTAMTKENNTYFIIQKCQRIEGNSICTRENLMNYSLDTCYSKLLRGQPGNCTFVNYKNEDLIKPLTSRHIIINSKHFSTIRSSCGITQRNVTGTFLIEFCNCSVTVNETTFTNLESIHTAQSFVLPLQGLRISEEKFEKSLTTQDLQIENRRYLTDLTRTHQQHAITTFGISTCSLILVVITVIYLLKPKNCKLTIFTQLPVKTVPNPETGGGPNNPTHRDVASSDGGAVKDKSFYNIQSSTPEPATRQPAIIEPSIGHQHQYQHLLAGIIPATTSTIASPAVRYQGTNNNPDRQPASHNA